MENNFDNMPDSQDAQTGGQEIQETTDTGLNTEGIGQDSFLSAGTDSGQLTSSAGSASEDSGKFTDPNVSVDLEQYTASNTGYGQGYDSTGNYQQGQNYGSTGNYQQNQSYGGTGSNQQNQSYGNTNYQKQYQSCGNMNYQKQYQDNYNYNVGSNTGYSQNYTDGMDTAPMSMGEWVITLLIMGIPCLNIIFCCVWAFGKTGNVNRRNFCRAELIFIGIALALSIIFGIIMAVAGFGANRYYYY